MVHRYSQENVDRNEATHKIVGGPYGSAYCSICKYSEFTCWEHTCKHLQKTSTYRVVRAGAKGKVVLNVGLTPQQANKLVEKMKEDHVYYEIDRHKRKGKWINMK